MTKRQLSAFTLIELLTVVAIIAILAGIIMPVVTGMLEKSRTTQCSSNMRQIGIATIAFAADNNGRLPLSSHQRKSWVATLQPYSGKKLLFRCPKDDHPTREYSYALNDRLLPEGAGKGDEGLSVLARLDSPTSMLLFAEAASASAGSDHLHTEEYVGSPMPLESFQQQVAVKRHAGAANYVFVDGHVETLTPEMVAQRLERQGSQDRPSNSDFLGGDPATAGAY